MSSQSPEPETQGPSAGSPSEFLKNIVGKRVKVRIGSGVDYHGELFDRGVLSNRLYLGLA